MLPFFIDYLLIHSKLHLTTNIPVNTDDYLAKCGT